jgi:hypothetical protein
MLADNELDELLIKWHAPSPPDRAPKHVVAPGLSNVALWLLKGTVPVPVLITVLLAAGLLISVVLGFHRSTSRDSTTTRGKGSFRAVSTLEVRVLRNTDEIAH